GAHRPDGGDRLHRHPPRGRLRAGHAQRPASVPPVLLRHHRQDHPAALAAEHAAEIRQRPGLPRPGAAAAAGALALLHRRRGQAGAREDGDEGWAHAVRAYAPRHLAGCTRTLRNAFAHNHWPLWGRASPRLARDYMSLMVALCDLKLVVEETASGDARGALLA